MECDNIMITKLKTFKNRENIKTADFTTLFNAFITAKNPKLLLRLCA